MKKLTRRACVFSTPEFMQISTQSTGMIAYGDPDVEPFYTGHDVDSATLGKILRVALSFSKQVSLEEFHRILNSGVLEDTDKKQETLLVENYKYKNKREMLKKRDTCNVSAVDGQIEIQPCHQDSLEGYSANKVKGPFAIQVPEECSDEELGEALREAFKRCTSIYPRSK